VASSDIPVHREVYEDGSLYFNPYSVEDASRVVAELLSASPAARDRLKEQGKEVSSRYLPARIQPAWTEFFQRHRTVGANALTPATI
jgi:hypothetical protein